MNTPRTALLACALLLAVAACGNDSANANANDSATGPDAPALTAAEFRSAANAICVETNGRIGQVVGELFASGAPDPAKMQSALDEVLDASGALADGVEALAAPPELQSQVDAMVSEVRTAIATAEEQGGAAYWTSEGDPFAAATAKAEALGLEACAADDE